MLMLGLHPRTSFAFEQSKNKNDMKLFSWIKEKINPELTPEQVNSPIEPEIFPEEIILSDLEETPSEEKKVNLTEPTDSLVDAVNEYKEHIQNQPILSPRELKIKQKFNRSDDDLTIKY